MRRWLIIAAAVAVFIVALPLITADSPVPVLGAGPSPTPAHPANAGGSAGGGNQPNPGNGDAESFRRDLKTYLAGMQDTVNALQSNPNLSHRSGKGPSDPSAALRVAQQYVDSLDTQSLQELQKRFPQSTNWRDQPAKLKHLIDNVGPGPSTHPGGGKKHSGVLPAGPAANGVQFAGLAQPEYQMPAQLSAMLTVASVGPYRGDVEAVRDALSPPRQGSALVPADTAYSFPVPFLEDASDCPGGNARALFYSYWAAAQVASAASAVASGIPSAVDYVAATIIAGVAYGVANDAAIALQYELSRSVDCINYEGNVSFEAAFPNNQGTPTGEAVDRNDNAGDYLPASSQVAVDGLATLVGGIATALNDIQDKTSTIKSNLYSLISKLGTAQGTANGLHNTLLGQPPSSTNADGLVAQADLLHDTIGKPTDPHTGDKTSNGMANDINDQEDTVLSNMNSFQALSLQMEIERAMALSATPSIALYALPGSQGGYLGTVKDIANNTVTNMKNAGQSIGSASNNLATANQAYAACLASPSTAGAQCATAYTYYAKAYESATQVQ